jgi:aldehyde dehydrogenase (NAD+)
MRRAVSLCGMLHGVPDHAARIAAQRRTFASGATLTLAARRSALEELRASLRRHEDAVLEALTADLGKPAAEAYSSELGYLYQEIRYALRHLPGWMRPRGARWDIAQFPGRARIHREPFGVALIIGPWNYPVQLLLAPLVAALAAGNVAILKPSELTPASEAVVGRIIADAFDPAWVSVVTGDATMTRALLQQRFDKIFFTGSTAVGRKVMVAAAHHLTPVTLELGGKSPAVVAADADVATAARRIVWGKFLNSGQTCVAPDFVAVHASVKEALSEALISEVQARYGPDPQPEEHLARLVHRGHAERLRDLMQGERILFGGSIDAEARFAPPTILEVSDWESPIMREEIFGPLLPLLSFDDEEALIARLRERPKPLALYLFSRDRALHNRFRRGVASGGLVINGTLQHIISSNLPFGGVGESGMGSYHGRAGFEAFTRPRSELHLPARLPWSLADVRKLPPLAQLRRLMR